MNNPEFALILNPESGSNGDGFADKVRAALENSGRAFICLETDPDKGAAPAVEKAIKSGVHTVIACGGDGTVMSTVNALGKAEADLKLAIVPGGTANLLARALKVPLEPEAAVASALEGHEKRIDLGVCGPTLFALGLGLGLTEKLVSEASAEEKERLGKWAYVKAMLEEVGSRPSTFKYSLDDGPEQSAPGVAVVVANVGSVGGQFEFAPGAKMDDGLLDLVILHHFNALDLVRLGWRSFIGSLENDRAVTCLTGKKIHIQSDPPLDLQIDGETVDLQPPLEVEVKPGALRVVVPSAPQTAAAEPDDKKFRLPPVAWAGGVAVLGWLIWQLSHRNKE